MTIYTYAECCTRGGHICHDPWTDDMEISGDVTEWTGTREELIEQLLPVARRRTGRPDFDRVEAINILDYLDAEGEY